MELPGGLKFQAIAGDELRQAQLNKTSWEDLKANLLQIAGSLGIDFVGTPELGGWPYALPRPYETDMAEVMAATETAYAEWKANGMPAPPPNK